MMRDEIIKCLSNLDLDETEPVYDGLKRFIMGDDFNIEVNGITIFFDGSNVTKKLTYIEINEDHIAFRTEIRCNQTTYVTFRYEDIKALEFELDNEYYYFDGDWIWLKRKDI